MPQAPGCLFDILKEVKLESFHDNFYHHGVTKCEALAGLSMQDYPKYGVVTMEDRVRLFKLVQIVKSVQAEGVFCRHQPSQMQFQTQKCSTDQNTNMQNVTEPKEVVLKNDNARNEINKYGHLQQTQSNRQHIQHERISNTSNIRLISSGNMAHQPNLHVHAPSTVSGNTKAARNTAAHVHVVDVNMANTRKGVKSETVARKKKDDVQINPKTGSPIFKCRKTLSFSDSDDDQSSQEGSGKSTSTVVQVSPTITQTVERQLSHPKLPIKTVIESLERQHRQSEITHQIPEAYFLNLDSSSENVNSEEIVKNEVTREHHEHIDTQYSMLPDNQHSDSGLGTARSENSSGSEKYVANQNILNQQLGDLNKTILLVAADPSQGQINSIMTSHDSTAHLNVREESKSTVKPNPSFPSIPSPLRPKASKVCSFFVEHEAPPNHAYFPAFQDKSPCVEPKPAFIERIIHTSRDYNYGVPGSLGQGGEQGVGLNTRENIGNDLQKRIRVCVRKRPLTKREVKRHEVDVIRVQGAEAVIIEEAKVAIDLTRYIHEHMFLFDEVFDESCNNEALYHRTAQPLVEHVLNRGCATCFAFGQTGAGKTYTLLGTKSVPGLYQLAARDIFSHIESDKQTNELRVWASYYEIYCSQLYDLLNKKKRLNVRENARQQVCIAGLTETLVNTAKQLVQVVSYGNSSRSVGSTGVNAASSRSHAILQLEIRNTKDKRIGRMSFIDLAGSERASDVTDFDRQTRIEGAEINQSLLALKECIRAIDQDSKHTPYRQSKLTHILRDSFLGNSRTCMIANISPSQSACENTLNTLHYADRVKELRQNSQVHTAKTPVKTPSDEENQEMAAEVVRPKLRKAFAPTLFHPSNIQLSSTPKATPTKSPPKQESSGTNSLDLTKALQEAYESPIRGHRIRKTGDRKKSQSRSRRSSGGSDTKSSSFLSGHSEKLNRSSRDGSSDNEKVPTPRSKSTKTSPAVTKEKLNIEVVREPSADRLKNRRSDINILSEKQIIYQQGNDTSGLDCHIYSSGKAASVSASQKRNKSDFVAEHKQMLSHLDQILDRAKAAVDSSRTPTSDSSNNISSPHLDNGVVNAASLTGQDRFKEKEVKQAFYSSRKSAAKPSPSNPYQVSYLPNDPLSSRLTQSTNSYRRSWVNGSMENGHARNGVRSEEHRGALAARKLFTDIDQNEQQVSRVEHEKGENVEQLPLGQMNKKENKQLISSTGNIAPKCHDFSGEIIQVPVSQYIQPNAVQSINLSNFSSRNDIHRSFSESVAQNQQNESVPSVFQEMGSTDVPKVKQHDNHNKQGLIRGCDRVATPVPGAGIEFEVLEVQRQADNIEDIDPEQFLRSLAEMRLARKLLDNKLENRDPPPEIGRPSFQLNPELSRLAGNSRLVYKTDVLEAKSHEQSLRPFQALLDSPSNVRKDSPFQPYNGQSQITCPKTQQTTIKEVTQAANTHISGNVCSQEPRRARGDGASESCESAAGSGGNDSTPGDHQVVDWSCDHINGNTRPSKTDVNSNRDASQSSQGDSGFLTQAGSSGISLRQIKRSLSPGQDASQASTIEDVSSLQTQVCISTSNDPLLSSQNMQITDSHHQTQSHSCVSDSRLQESTAQVDDGTSEHAEVDPKYSEAMHKRQTRLGSPTEMTISPIRTEKLDASQAGTTFVPIHPFPTNKDKHAFSNPNIITKSVVTPNGLTRQETDELRLALQRELERDVSSEQDISVFKDDEYMTLGSQEDQTETPRSTNSSMASSGKESAIHRAKCLLIRAHEEQLAETTSLCKQEMTLLMKIKEGDANFEEYMEVLHHLIASKAQSVATLKSQMEEFEAYSDTASATAHE